MNDHFFPLHQQGCLPFCKPGSFAQQRRGPWHLSGLRVAEYETDCCSWKRESVLSCLPWMTVIFYVYIHGFVRQFCIPINHNVLLYCHKVNLGNVISPNWQQGLGKYSPPALYRFVVSGCGWRMGTVGRVCTSFSVYVCVVLVCRLEGLASSCLAPFAVEPQLK